ncbi:MAG: heavy metal translocating P-type ATPase metal-binding domain-containing protein [Melioribacteraceae bacterium]|nr:heavy metal translocating P-type ATPase metal-binding domain-containing protein [Melioribacteraceae bacterium]MCF8355706.1 heavy metal translocating P-type ATPase metal-binding domain-containing protein [Melioribacteraceae bacterium]MCF8394436.1 heavy metal translocating P-type ATPase metal-binding domain-containing protein [Melioribacteraceae bacterium]MCF8418570.1 heavy metal translocating P-type ATPase metal-binding domain-containing protein [Melioribacteraceae bacterium]
MNLINTDKIIETTQKCYHCGEDCIDDLIQLDGKLFCCNGCKTVYEILNQNNLCNYYDIEEAPGINKKEDLKRNYDFLEDTETKQRLIDFTDGQTTTVTFFIPQIHCSSCIWVLENLHKLDEGILGSQVNFLSKKLSVRYKEDHTHLKQIVLLLDSIGYQPLLNLDEKPAGKDNQSNKKLYYKIGVAGFAFGNIMLLSFPEYLSLNAPDIDNIKPVFSILNILLSLPVFFYSSTEYFISAYKGLRKKIVNIDVPISLGIIVLFTRSLFEILTQTGAGYLDSLSGLVFFLLIGKLFQSKTYEALNFERNYKSYFPIAVTIRKDKKETTKPVSKLNTGDRIIIKNNEIIPADAVLIKGKAAIDYSFVTGESLPVQRSTGDLIYAGGKQTGSAIELEIVKEVNQSYLTQLWKNKAFDKNYDNRMDNMVDVVSKYFTFIILAIASISAIAWMPESFSSAMNVFTAILIVACPCALALSTPFTLGNTLRIFGRNKFYVKNTTVIEKLTKIDEIVFDKTGTITESGKSHIKFTGDNLTAAEKSMIKSLVRNSSHPLSQNLFMYLDSEVTDKISNYIEIPGKGISGIVDGVQIKVGSANFVGETGIDEDDKNLSTKVYLSIDNKQKGFFSIENFYRSGLRSTVEKIKDKFSLSILSGDNDGELEQLKNFFPAESRMLFRQSPHDKLNYIEKLQRNNKSVLMIGDGLNDAGALKISDVGITISDNTNNFSPACDGILEAKSFIRLSDFILFSKTSKKIVIASFVISFLYNVIGLSFAVSGNLSPLVAAILMPLSSISVVVFTTVTTNIFAKVKGLI